VLITQGFVLLIQPYFLRKPCFHAAWVTVLL